jgi:prepilin-type N-terminal cleavage/methylation domain-containing protein
MKVTIKSRKSQKGFTLTELAIVIAALLVVVVLFVGIPLAIYFGAKKLDENHVAEKPVAMECTPKKE